MSLGVAASGDGGFDIDVDGTAFASLNVGGLNQLYHVNLSTGAATAGTPIGDGNLSIGGLAALSPSVAAFGPDSGMAPNVTVIDPLTGGVSLTVAAFPSTMKKGVRVALGDVDLDGVPDLITGPGPGVLAEIHTFSGVSGFPIGPSFLPFETNYKGGVYVASGDVNGDGMKDAIVARAKGAPPEVKVFSAFDGSVLTDVTAFESTFKGGVTVAAADFDRDGDVEIVVGAGKGRSPDIHVYDSAGLPFTSVSLPSFDNDITAFAPTFKGGVFVAAGDVDGDGIPDIIAGAGRGGVPEVHVFDGEDGSQMSVCTPFSSKLKKGVRVATADVDADGKLDVIATLGSGALAEVVAFDGKTCAAKTSYTAFLNSKKGVFVAGVRR
jgi:hypothetical protein